MSLIWGCWDRGSGQVPPARLEPVAQVARLAVADREQQLWLQPGLLFGHRTFWLRAEQETQPIQCEDGSLALTGDILLDNAPELRAQLGIPEPGCGDARLVLEAYRAWGPSMSARLRGDFAFALWDARQQCLFCCRDAVGARPFYYRELGDAFCFASDLEVLRAFPGPPARLDLECVNSRLRYRGFTSPSRTILAGFLRLAPGDSLVVRADRLDRQSYWQPQRALLSLTRSQSVERVREVMEASVRSCQDCAVPFASHLSGGLDSSAVTVLAARSSTRYRGAFCWSPSLEEVPLGGSVDDERLRVEAVRQQEGLSVFYGAPQPADLLQVTLLDRAIFPVQELDAEWNISRRATALGARMILSGWGGDELLSASGIRVLAEMLRQGKVWRMLGESRSLSRREGVPWLSLLLSAALRPLLSSFLRRPPRLLQLAPYLHPDLCAALDRTPLLEWSTVVLRSLQDQKMWALAHSAIAYRMESWASLGYRRGLRYRFPMLDRRCVELALAVPSFFHIGEGWRRALFRKACEAWLPARVCWHSSKIDACFAQARRAVRRAVYPAFRAHALAHGNRRLVVPERLPLEEIAPDRRSLISHWLVHMAPGSDF